MVAEIEFRVVDSVGSSSHYKDFTPYPSPPLHPQHNTTQHSFRMHHCEPEYVMLNLWLRKGENKIPPFATHVVGVAGLVLNKKKEVLLVKEGSKHVSGWCVPFSPVMLLVR